MKFSTTILLLLSAPTASYTPNAPWKQSNKQAGTSTILSYVDPVAIEKPAVEPIAAVEWFFLDDAYTTALKEQLGFSEEDIQEQYAGWLMKYDKVADESRYMTFKKNFLMQEEYNQKYGASFSLNGYGDMTEQEFRAMKTGAPVVVETEPVAESVVAEPQLVIEEEVIELKPVAEAEDTVPGLVIEAEDLFAVEESNDEDSEQNQVEIIDETDEIFVEKYQAIEDAEERAFEVLKDLKIVKAAPQHYSFSYVDETPALKLEAGATYIDALHKPDLSAIDGSATLSGYLSSMEPSETGTFEEGKKGSTLGASANYLDDICDMLEPFLDCDYGKTKARTPIVITSPVEDFVNDRVAQIKSMSDKAFRVLVELCQIGRCERT